MGGAQQRTGRGQRPPGPALPKPVPSRRSQTSPTATPPAARPAPPLVQPPLPSPPRLPPAAAPGNQALQRARRGAGPPSPRSCCPRPSRPPYLGTRAPGHLAMGRPGRRAARAGARREMGKGRRVAWLEVPPPPLGTVCVARCARRGASARGWVGKLREGVVAEARKSRKRLQEWREQAGSFRI